MNRNVIVCLAVMVAAGTGFCQEAKPGAQQPGQKMPMRQQMQPGMQRQGMACPMMGGMQQPGMNCPMMGNNMAPQHQGMLGRGMDRGMMQPGMQGQMQMKPQASMVPSDNGGIIVLRGNTLYKFDKDFNLLRAAELPRPAKEIEKKPPVKENKGKK